MAEDTIFSIHEAILSNLKRLSNEESTLGELKAYELYDVATAMSELTAELFADGLDVYEILSLLSESLDYESNTLPSNTSGIFARLAEKDSSAAQRKDRAVLTELYLDLCKKHAHPLTDSDFLPSHGAEETFTYVRNSFSDEAYDVFSQDFDDPKVRYSPTFKDAARAVASGDVTYCLLPLEEKGGVRLHTVAELIFRNDFRINSVIPVFGQDGNADLKYALVSKSFTVPKRDPDDDLYLEIRLGMSSDSLLAEVFGAVDYFGMSVYRVNTVTFDTEGESETYFSVVIKGADRDFSPILTYMALFVRDFVPVGIYKNLE